MNYRNHSTSKTDEGRSAGLLLRSIGLTRNYFEANAYVEAQGPSYFREKVAELTKAATGATSTGSFGNALEPVHDLLQIIARRSVLPRLPGVRRAPLNTRVFGVGTEVLGTIRAEGSAIPVYAPSMAGIVLSPITVATMAVATQESLRAAKPELDTALATLVGNAVADAGDAEFLKFTTAATTIVGTGTTITAIDANLASAIAALPNADPRSMAWVIPGAVAMRMALLRGSGGELAYPDLDVVAGDGRLAGLPVVISSATGAAASTIALVDGAGVVVADDDESLIQIQRSEQGSLQMNTTPDNPTTASTVQVSLWQNDLVAFRATWLTSWYVSPTSVARITGVAF